MGMVKRKIGDILTLQRGYDLPASKMEGGNVAVVGSNGIIGYHNIVKYDAPCIIVGRSGSVGKVRYYSIPTWPHNTALFVKDFKGNDPLYLYYFLKNLHLDEKFSKSSSVVPSLDRNIVHSLHVQFQEDINEQKNIAKILSAFDIKIALNRQINDNLEAMAKQLYDYWFVQFDFPDENGKPYKSSSGKMVWNEKLKRNIPELWTDTTLGCICDLYQPQTLGLSLLSDDEPFKVYGANGIVGHYNKYNHEQSEIAMACRGNSCGVLNRTMPKSWITGNAMVIHLKDETINNEFIKQALKYANVKGAISGSGQPQLTRENLEVLNIIKPSQRILLLYSNVVAPLVEKEINMEKEIDRLTKQRNTLLPLLMNGQVTINYHLSFGILFVYLFLYSQNMEYVWQQKIY